MRGSRERVVVGVALASALALAAIARAQPQPPAPPPAPSAVPSASAAALPSASASASVAPSPPPLIGLGVHRTDDTLGCPDARALAQAVERQMKRPALAPDVQPIGLEVQIYKSEQGFTAVIAAGGKTRQIADKGRTCQGLSDALAITIAILLDTEPIAVPPPVLTAAPPPPIPIPVPRPAEPPPLLPPAQVSLDELPDAPRVWSISASFGAVESAGLTLPFSAGFDGGIEARASRIVSFDIGILRLPSQSIPFNAGHLDVSLTASYFRACFTLLGSPSRLASLGLCVRPLVGELRGENIGDTTVTTSKPWVALDGELVLGGKLIGPLGWNAHAGFVVPVTLQNFCLNPEGQFSPACLADSSTVFSASAVGTAFDAKVRLTIW